MIKYGDSFADLEFTYDGDVGAEVVTDDKVRPLLTCKQIPSYEIWGHKCNHGEYRGGCTFVKLNFYGTDKWVDVYASEDLKAGDWKGFDDAVLGGWDRIAVHPCEPQEGLTSGQIYRFADGGVIAGKVLLQW